MDPFEPLKYQKPLMALKARIAEEGSKAVFAPLIEKFILNNPHRVTIEMQVLCYKRKAELSFIGRDHIISLELLNCTSVLVSLIQRWLLVMKQPREKPWIN